MNISRTTPKSLQQPKRAITASAEKTETEAAKDGMTITVNLYELKGRAVGAGAGAAATTALAYAFSQGGLSIGGVAGALLIGGAIGTALTSETAKNGFASLKSTAASALDQFQEARRERQLQQRLEAEKAAKAEELFQQRIEREAEAEVEARMAAPGTAERVEQMVQSGVEKKLEEQAAPLVESRVAERLPQFVEERVEQALQGEKAAEIDAKVTEGVKLRVESRIAEETANQLESRMDREVETRLRSQLSERSEEIEKTVAERVEAFVESRVTRERSKLSHADLIAGHRKIARSLGAQSRKASATSLQSSLQSFKDSEEFAPSDRKLLGIVLGGSGVAKWSWKSSSDQWRTFNDVLDGTMELLAEGSKDRPVSELPEAYLNVSQQSGRDLRSRTGLLRAGLLMMADDESLNDVQRNLCKTATKTAMDTWQQQFDYYTSVMKTLG